MVAWWLTENGGKNSKSDYIFEPHTQHEKKNNLKHFLRINISILKRDPLNQEFFQITTKIKCF